MTDHKYEGGSIEPPDFPMHYHVSFFRDTEEENNWYEEGLVVEVWKDGTFHVCDDFEYLPKDISPDILVYETLDEAVAFCMGFYNGKFGKNVRPCFGAGAPNEALQRLGYRWSAKTQDQSSNN